MTTPTRAPASRSLVGIVVAVVLAGLFALAGSAGGLTIGGWPVFAVCTALAFVVNWVAYVPALRMRTERFYDLTGTLTYVVVTLVALVAGSGSTLSVVLAVMVVAWSVRLGTFLFLRILASGGDQRFDEIKTDPLRFLLTWTMQGLWVVITSGAAVAAMTSGSQARVGLLAVLGILMWAVGFGIEWVADAQKRAFRADPANKGRFISTGVWAWSRHPNYFGEITLWVGVALVALPALSGWQYLTLISPVFVTLLLTRISGIPLLEARGRREWGEDPDYQRYLARTPVLVPRPPGGR